MEDSPLKGVKWPEGVARREIEQAYVAIYVSYASATNDPVRRRALDVLAGKYVPQDGIKWFSPHPNWTDLLAFGRAVERVEEQINALVALYAAEDYAKARAEAAASVMKLSP